MKGAMYAVTITDSIPEAIRFRLLDEVLAKQLGDATASPQPGRVQARVEVTSSGIPDATYALALPDIRQYRGLVERHQPSARERL